MFIVPAPTIRRRRGAPVCRAGYATSGLPSARTWHMDTHCQQATCPHCGREKSRSQPTRAHRTAEHPRYPRARCTAAARCAHISCGRALSESRHRSAVRHMNADCPRKTRQRTKHGTSEGHCTRIVIIIIHCRVSLASTAARVCVQVCGRRAPRSSPRIRSTPDDLAGPFPPTDLRSLCLRRLSRANAASWCSKLMQQAHAASWCSKLVQQRVSRA